MYSFSSIFGDAKHFMLNAWKIIFIVTAVFLCLNELAIYVTQPSEEAINALFSQYHLNSFAEVLRITEQDQSTQVAFFKALFQMMKNYLFIAMVFSLLNLALFPALIAMISTGHFTISQLLQKTGRYFLTVILFCITLLFIAFICSFLIMLFMPLLYLCVLFLFILTLLFQAILIAQPELPFGEKLKVCFMFFKKESKLILAGLACYIIVYLVLNLLISLLPEVLSVRILITLILLLVNQFILIYLYRLYDLSFRKVQN